MPVEDNRPIKVEVKNLTKHYSLLESPAVKDVSFCAKEGKITILLGPNGAGKSTLMNIITGNLKPTSGIVLWDGKDTRDMGD